MNLADSQLLSRAISHLRRKRFALFRELVGPLARPLRILDVGGTEHFWVQVGFAAEPGVHVTILNVTKPVTTLPSFTGVVGDARSMPEFADGEFDVAFYNSVIEHVGALPEQLAMAAEMQRVGKRYFVQTPNRRFPLEPHFLVPWFQYLPEDAKVWLIRRWRLGHVPRQPDPDKARALARSTQLMTKAELVRAFPDARIYEETVLGLPKSFICYEGF